MNLNSKQFYFNKSERTGVITLSIIIISLISVPRFYSTKDEQANFKYLQAEIEYETQDIRQGVTIIKDKITPKVKDITVLNLKKFNLNSVTKEDLLSMGFPKFGVENFIKYRNTGAIFYDEGILKKIRGFESLDIENISSYLVFNKTKKTKATINSTKTINNSAKKYNNVAVNLDFSIKKQRTAIDINTADLDELQTLIQIGPYRAKMILSYRNYLGGFNEFHQLKATYNVPDSVFDINKEFIVIDKSKINKIDINALHIDSLAKTHLFNYKQARLIDNYRKQHGFIKSIEKLHSIKAFDTTFVNKISAYLKFNVDTLSEASHKLK